jgi:hypothetical protein
MTISIYIVDFIDIFLVAGARFGRTPHSNEQEPMFVLRAAA